ncbi:ATP-binding protein [Streptomyces sp. HNM0663]|uniref:ATP-binding protein n=1 Tax=Streptomyces chengmaiensis TaxID=3040919 RepID=A0ABT6HZ66_9ACTN|nr:ATP-binding protein [Streptomyces chengmaiensis]MDH2394013.1 ATP-binding protein [Streptomyces chengmaiensis]
MHTESAPRSTHTGSPERVSVPPEIADWGLQLRISAPGFTARRLTCRPESVAQARSFTRRALRRWHLGAVSDDAVTVASELVGNAVRHALPHASTPDPVAWLGLIRNPAHLVCAVTDPVPAPPAHVCLPDPLTDTGRGLSVVNALTHTWGWTRLSPTGKTVWAVLLTWPHA